MRNAEGGGQGIEALMGLSGKVDRAYLTFIIYAKVLLQRAVYETALFSLSKCKSEEKKHVITSSKHQQYLMGTSSAHLIMRNRHHLHIQAQIHPS